MKTYVLGPLPTPCVGVSCSAALAHYGAQPLGTPDETRFLNTLTSTDVSAQHQRHDSNADQDFRLDKSALM